MEYSVKIMRWTPDDYVLVGEFKSRYMLSALFIKLHLKLCGWQHVFISKINLGE